MTRIPESLLSRRSLLLGATAGAALLAGCSTGTTQGKQAGTKGSTGQLPAYLPYDKVKADIPAANDYSVPGYLTYPAEALVAVPDKPGDGSKVTGFTQTSISAAPPMHQNGWWQNLNDKLGVTLDLKWVNGAEYVAKVQTMLAGDSLPEVTLLPPLPRMDQMLKAKYADLSPYLSGDKVADYPMLANFPTASWQETVFDGSLYGIPRPLLPIGSRLEARTDTLEKLGIKPEFGDAEEFSAVCHEITDRKAGRFAMVQPTAVFIKSMFSLPNVWEKTEQGLRNEIESERYPEYLEFVTKMWSDGLFHPESFQSPALIPFFQKPAFVLFEVGGAGFTRAMPLYRPGAPTLTVAPVIAPLAEGGGHAAVRIGAASSSMLGIRKDLSADRIKLILSVLNYTAAPFGTQEYLNVQYGKDGHNYTLDGEGQPEASTSVTNELFPVTLFPGSPNFMYSPDFPDVVEKECAYEKAVGDNVLLNPTTGMFSETETSKGQQLGRDLALTISDIIQGRKPVSSWPDVVKDWTTKGGNEMRQEYEAQL